MHLQGGPPRTVSEEICEILVALLTPKFFAGANSEEQEKVKEFSMCCCQGLRTIFSGILVLHGDCCVFWHCMHFLIAARKSPGMGHTKRGALLRPKQKPVKKLLTVG